MSKKPQSKTDAGDGDYDRFRNPNGSNSFGVDYTKFKDWTVLADLQTAIDVDKDTAIRLVRKTNNPVWIWLSLAHINNIADIPTEYLLYFKVIGSDFLASYLQQVMLLEAKILVGDDEGNESFSRIKPPSPKSNDLLRVFGFSQPGKNLFAQAARDYRSLSVYRQIEDIMSDPVFKKRDDAFAELATRLGRNSAETGPSVAAIKKFYRIGRKLAS